MSTETDLCWRSAEELLGMMLGGEVSAVEVLEAHLHQIERVNPTVNAIVTLDIEGARAAARAADSARSKGTSAGPLHGLPIAIKDLEDTAGLRTTYGSPIYADHVPTEDSPLVSALRAAGAVIVGKTNTPEFGAGSQTFNEVFGPTRNPYSLDSTVGGSSGGAAAAVACGMIPIADGSDLGASVRNPAAFCNVVGLRPSPGRWPDAAPDSDLWDPLPVLGPIARSVSDCWALFKGASTQDFRSPISLDGVLEELGSAPNATGVRVAWSEDLGGLPVSTEVTDALRPMRRTIAEMGCVVEDAEPDLSVADEAFETLRALSFVSAFEDLLEEHRDQLKDTIIWDVERGLKLTGSDVARAVKRRSDSYSRMRQFLTEYDFLVLPVTQLAPFSLEIEWVTEIQGQSLDNYLQWMRSCSRITATSHPAVSLPAGFTADGRPVGLQIVGRYRDEKSLMEFAAALEKATGFGKRRPPVCLESVA